MSRIPARIEFFKTKRACFERIRKLADVVDKCGGGKLNESNLSYSTYVYVDTGASFVYVATLFTSNRRTTCCRSNRNRVLGLSGPARSFILR